MKGKQFTIDYDTYPGNTLVFAGAGKDYVIGCLRDNLDDDYDLLIIENSIDSGLDFVCSFPKGKMLVFFKDEQPSVGIIAHEALHVVERIMEYIGNGSVPVNETWNYLLEHIVSKIHNGLF